MKLRSILLSAAAALACTALAVQAQVPGVNSTLNAVFTLAYDNSTMKPTYSAAGPSFAAPNNGGDICSLYGSATKTVKVRRVFFAAVTGALQTDPISIVKRVAVSNGGTVNTVPMTVAAYDTSNEASTVITDIYTTVPTTLGATTTLMDVFVTLAGATTAVAQNQPYVFEFGKLGQPIVLRGVAQGVHVNDAGLAAITAQCGFEWTEETP